MKYTLGVDFGGGAGKGTLLDETGVVVMTASKEYGTYSPFNGWTEIEPEEYYQAFCWIVREILDKTGVDPAEIAALSVSSASMTAAYLDEHDKPVRRAIFWNDNRSTKQADFLRENYAAEIYAKSHNCVSSARTLTHLLWIRENEPGNFSRIRRVMFMKDYVRYRLTGLFVTDYIDAMGSQLMDVPAGCWSEKFLKLAGLPLSAMPQILSPTDVVGSITEDAARETGLSRKTKVICGTTDTVMEVFANGAIRPGQMTLKLATAGRICDYRAQP